MKTLFIVSIAIILFVAGVSGYIFYNQLNQQKAELVSIEQRIEVVKEQITQTTDKITALNQDNDTLKQRVSESEKQVGNYKNQVNELKSKKELTFYKLQDKRQELIGLKKELEGLTAEETASHPN